MKTVVIGGGPAGMMSAIKASNIRRQCYTLGKNGRLKVMEWYDFRVMWPLVEKLYAKILN